MFSMLYKTTDVSLDSIDTTAQLRDLFAKNGNHTTIYFTDLYRNDNGNNAMSRVVLKKFLMLVAPIPVAERPNVMYFVGSKKFDIEPEIRTKFDKLKEHLRDDGRTIIEAVMYTKGERSVFGTMVFPFSNFGTTSIGKIRDIFPAWLVAQIPEDMRDMEIKTAEVFIHFCKYLHANFYSKYAPDTESARFKDTYAKYLKSHPETESWKQANEQIAREMLNPKTTDKEAKKGGRAMFCGGDLFKDADGDSDSIFGSVNKTNFSRMGMNALKQAFTYFRRFINDPELLEIFELCAAAIVDFVELAQHGPDVDTKYGTGVSSRLFINPHLITLTDDKGKVVPFYSAMARGILATLGMLNGEFEDTPLHVKVPAKIGGDHNPDFYKEAAALIGNQIFPQAATAA